MDPSSIRSHTGVAVNAAGTGLVLLLTSRPYQREMLRLHRFLPERRRLLWHVLSWYAVYALLSLAGGWVVVSL